MRLNLGSYSKAITAVIGQALAYAALYYGGNKYVAAAVAIAAALGVYAVPNSRPEEAPKSDPHGM